MNEIGEKKCFFHKLLKNKINGKETAKNKQTIYFPERGIFLYEMLSPGTRTTWYFSHCLSSQKTFKSFFFFKTRSGQLTLKLSSLIPYTWCLEAEAQIPLGCLGYGCQGCMMKTVAVRKGRLACQGQCLPARPKLSWRKAPKELLPHPRLESQSFAQRPLAAGCYRPFVS